MSSRFTLSSSSGRGSPFKALADRIAGRASALERADELARVHVERRLRPAASRELRKHVNLRAGTLRDALSTDRRHHDDRNEVLLLASDRRLPLLEYGARWRGPARRRSGRLAPPATAEIIRGHRRQYGSAFIATAGRRHVYARQQQGDGRAPRGPLVPLYGPSVATLFLADYASDVSRAARVISTTLVADMQSQYLTELRRQYARLSGGSR